MRSRWTAAALLFLLLLGLAVALSAGRAEAHGVQVSSDPPPNTQLADPPGLITITFSEPIEPSVSRIELWDQSAQQVTLGSLEFFEDPKKMAVHVPDDLPSGIYTVIWRNLSTVDGHTWSGSFPFTILGPGGQVPEGTVPEELLELAQAPSGNPSTLESAARWVVLLGSAVMLGGTAYVLFAVTPAARLLTPDTRTALQYLSRIVLLVTTAIAAFLVLEGSLLQLIVQADRLGGLGQTDNLLVDTRSGHYLLARQGLLLLALGALALVWRARDIWGERLALGVLLVASFGVLLTQSLVSHAAASDGPFWTTTIDVLHLLAAALWVGMLIHIGLAMPRWLDELKGASRTVFAAESFRRFSILAAASVVVLLASGVLSALVQFTSFDDLWSSSYGWSLVAKMGAMLPLLAVAGLNAFVLRPRIEAAGLTIAGGANGEGAATDEPVARLQRLLASTVRAEAALGIVVLVAVAVLIQLQPPRAAAEAAEQAAANIPPVAPPPDRGFIQDDVEVEGLIMVLKVEPGKLGENTFELGLGAEFGGIGEVTDVRLDFDHPQAGEGGSRLPLRLTGSAKYTAKGSNLSLPGQWLVTATVRRRGEDDAQATFTIPIAGSKGSADTATGSEESESIWRWPFEGKRSAAAIALLAAVGAGAAGWGAWRLVRRRAA